MSVRRMDIPYDHESSAGSTVRQQTEAERAGKYFLQLGSQLGRIAAGVIFSKPKPVVFPKP